MFEASFIRKRKKQQKLEWEAEHSAEPKPRSLPSPLDCFQPHSSICRALTAVSQEGNDELRIIGSMALFSSPPDRCQVRGRFAQESCGFPWKMMCFAGPAVHTAFPILCCFALLVLLWLWVESWQSLFPYFICRPTAALL